MQIPCIYLRITVVVWHRKYSELLKLIYLLLYIWEIYLNTYEIIVIYLYLQIHWDITLWDIALDFWRKLTKEFSLIHTLNSDNIEEYISYLIKTFIWINFKLFNKSPFSKNLRIQVILWRPHKCVYQAHFLHIELKWIEFIIYILML